MLFNINNSEWKAIPIFPLVKDSVVFFIYGLAIGLLYSYYKLQQASTEYLLGMALEPISLLAFLSIASVGFIFVNARAITLKNDIDRMKRDWLMQIVALPVSNVGLSAGAICIGMSVGLGSAFIIFEALKSGGGEDPTALLLSAVMVFLLLVPMIIAQKALFAVTAISKGVLNSCSFVYALLIVGLLIAAKIYLALGVAVVVIIGIMIVIRKEKKIKKPS